MDHTLVSMKSSLTSNHFNFQPWLDWYLKETGQRLVGGSGPFAPAAGGHGDADATSGASDSGDAGGHGGDADATAGASY
ncbi:oxidoreductase %2C truncated [Streptococcus pneumoniae]|nr:oxidoreductase %2C truncated [Streptococcus pneumoniae]CWC51034.1 oxidoreductase %2C truncated [Streptococcus pneumoniae]